MAIVRKSSSGKSIQFLDDEGFIYYTSVNFLMGLINNSKQGNFLLLKRLPVPTNMSRYKPSPIHDPDNILASIDPRSMDKAPDLMTSKGKENREKKKAFEDADVW